MSVLSDLLDYVKSRIDVLGLVDPVYGVVQVVRRKLPRKAESLDPPVQITVSLPDAPDEILYAHFTGNWWKYTIQITVIRPTDQNVDTNIELYTEWRELIRNLFTSFVSIPAIPNVFDARVRPLTLFNRAMLASNYDYQSLSVEFTSDEPFGV